MRRHFVLLFLIVCSFCLLSGQKELNNESVIKLIKASLSDDLIVSTINATPGNYDTSAEGLIALKSGGASDRVVSAIVLKTSAPRMSAPASGFPPINDPVAPDKFSVTPTLDTVPPLNTLAPVGNKPRVFLQSASKGTNRNAARDQSMEMSKDFERDCTDVRVTISQQMADYTVVLNHIEVTV